MRFEPTLAPDGCERLGTRWRWFGTAVLTNDSMPRFILCVGLLRLLRVRLSGPNALFGSPLPSQPCGANSSRYVFVVERLTNQVALCLLGDLKGNGLVGRFRNHEDPGWLGQWG